MSKQILKRLISLSCCFALVLGCFPGGSGMVTVASAAVSGSLSNDKIAFAETTREYTTNWILDGKNISGYTYGDSSGGCRNAKNGRSTVILTNDSGAAAYLSFEYAVTIRKDDSRDSSTPYAEIDGTKLEKSGNGTVDRRRLEAGESVTITLYSAKGTESDGAITSIAITMLDMVAAEVPGIDITFNAPINGTYSVTGEFGSVQETHNITTQTILKATAAADGIIVTATPNQGYVFNGWRDGNGDVISRASNTTLYLESATTISPSFITAREAVFSVNNVQYYTWEDAFSAAGNSGTVILLKDYTLPAEPDEAEIGRGRFVSVTRDDQGKITNATYTIGAGQTFLMPYEANVTPDSDAAIIQSNEDYPYANATWISTITDSLKQSDAYISVELTVPEGTKIQANGTFVIGGQISSAAPLAGGTTTKYAQLSLDGDLLLGQNSIFSTCGYVVGEGTISTVSTGAKVYQPMVIVDFNGGGHTSATRMAGAAAQDAQGNTTGETMAPPFLRYSIQNIQTDMCITAQNNMYVYCDLFADDKHQRTTPCMISGGGEEGLITMTTANSRVECAYDSETVVTRCGSVGKTTVDLYGGARYGSLKLDVNVKGVLPVSIETALLTFMIPYNFDITLNSGEYTIGQSMQILPGAAIRVASDASLNIAGDKEFIFMILDGFYDHTVTAASGKDTTASYGVGGAAGGIYPTTAELTAAGFSGTGGLIVDGELTIGSKVKFGGIVQTNGPTDDGTVTPTISVVNPAALRSTTQLGMVGQWKFEILGFGFDYRMAGATTRTLNAQVYDLATGNRVDMVAGTAYYGARDTNELGSYTFNLYTTSTNVATFEQHTENVDVDIVGGWWNCELPVYGVDNNGTPIGAEAFDAVKTIQGVDLTTYGSNYVKEFKLSGNDMQANKLYTDAGSTPVGTIAVANPLYSVVALPVKVIDQQIIDEKLTTVTTYHATLKDAVTAYSGRDAATAYIQMNDNYGYDGITETESVNYAGDLYLDLNGKDITMAHGTALSADKLYGIDTATNGYTATAETAGKIIGTVSGVQAPEKISRVAGVDRTYVALPVGNKTYFYRTSVSVTGIQFIRDSKGTYMIFRGGYKANDPVTLSQVGFAFNIADAEAAKTVTDSSAFEFYYGRSSADVTSAAATAVVNGQTVTSDVRTAVRDPGNTKDLTFQQVFEEILPAPAS